jgi:S1-C subfamily serine protease
MKQRGAFLIIGLALSIGVIFGLVVSGRISTVEQSVAGQPVEQSRPGGALAAGVLPDLSSVAERAIQASVNISSTQYVRADPFFQFFYGDAIQPQQSLGSGVIVSADGYVLTNSHVVGNAGADIKVTLPDSRELPAELVGVDSVSDLAVVKVRATGLAPLAWGNSDRLRVAEWVLAIGNPFAFNQTVTLGIVSAVNRHNPQLATYADMIQTDAAINPGNSGGALVNVRGELIGINTMIYSETGGYQGLGFAVPSNLAHQVMDELIKSGEVVRGDIGLAGMATVDPDDAAAAGYGRINGVVITSMYRNSPVHRAGLQIRDIIQRVNGKPITDSGQLQRIILDAKVGSRLTIDVLRGRRTVSFDVPVERSAGQRR